MIIAPDKSKCTLERLAIENKFMTENLKRNTDELLKRKEELKKLNEINEFELLLRKSRKTFCFEYKILENHEDIEIEIQQFIKQKIIEFNNNKIKELLKIYNFFYIKTKYNQIIETEEYITPHFKLNQINPKYLLKKQKQFNDLNI